MSAKKLTNKERRHTQEGNKLITHAPALERIPRQPRDTPLPLSFAQQRMWFLQQATPESTAYHLSSTFRLQGPLDRVALEASFNDLIARHDSLRTIFVTIDGEGAQVVGQANHALLPALDLSTQNPSTQLKELQRLLDEESQRLFDFGSGPLFRIQLFHLSSSTHVLRLTLHHIITDGWSMNILWKELTVLYTAHQSGRSVTLPPLPIQYADYAQWHRQQLQGPSLEKQLDYWVMQLADAPTRHKISTDFPRPSRQTSRGSLISFPVPETLVHALKILSQQEGVTVFMTLLAVFQLLLARYSGEQDILVGTPTAGRTHPDLGGLIGFFVDTLVLRARIKRHHTFLTFLQQIKTTCFEAYDHQDLPFQQLVEQLQPPRNPSFHPIFQVMFQLHRHRQDATLTLPNCQVDALPTTQQTAMFDLALSMEETRDSLKGTFIYSTDLFDSETITRLASHYRLLLENLLACPEQAILEVPFFTNRERDQLIIEGNASTKDYSKSQCLHQLVEAQVVQTPDTVSLVYEDHQVTYGYLNVRANQLAHYLRRLGVIPDQLVEVCLERSLDLAISLLAILKAGAAYVPLDPSYPKERLAFIIADTQSPVLITQQPMLEGLPPSLPSTVICLDSDWVSIVQEQADNLIGFTHPASLAYLIYTSGSTGAPKGVLTPNQALTNQILWMQENWPLSSDDRVLQKTPFSFDVSLWEFFWPLLSGAKLVMARPGGHQDTAYLRDVMVRQGITTIHFVPSMLSVFLEEPQPHQDLSSLQRVLCGGETLSMRLQDQFFKRTRAKLLHFYGPTEASIAVTGWTCQQNQSQPFVPLGFPVVNTQLYVLDTERLLVPVGVPGELYIGGIALARGYLNRAEQTAGRFLPDAYSRQPGARLYRTGDLVRYQLDDHLEFLGRRDNQVKLRGYRVELGEIEAVLNQNPEIQETIVLLREDEPENSQIVAYVVPVVNVSIDPANLRTGLKIQLPEYMIPSTFMILETLPLTSNGKVNRRKLPVPDSRHRIRPDTYVALQSTQEETLAGVWQELLKIDRVGRYDDFFRLGGHSLLAMQLVNRLNQAYHFVFPLRMVFDHPTLITQARTIEDFLWQEINNLSDSEVADLINDELLN